MITRKDPTRIALVVAACALTVGCDSRDEHGFGFSVFPTTVALRPGETANATIRLSGSGRGPVAPLLLSVSLGNEQAPPETTIGLTRSDLSSTQPLSTLVVQTSHRTPIGEYEVVIIGDQIGASSTTQTVRISVVQGTPDFSLEVDPAEYTWADAYDKSFEYSVRPMNDFTGEVALDLSGLGADFQLRDGPTPRTVTVGQGRSVGGSFVLRRQGAAPAPPREVVLTATGPDGLAHARTIRLSLLRPLELTCARLPDSGPAPLNVTFSAQGRECAGECSYRWDFGDGDGAAQANASHVYRAPGQYNAIGTYRDGSLDRSVNCIKFVEVSAPPSAEPAPTGPRPGNHPPSISTPVVTLTYGLAHIGAAVTDPDQSDSVIWELEVVSSPPGSAGFHFIPASGSGPSLDAVFESFHSGTYTVRIRAHDSQGAQATRDVTFFME